MSLFPPPTFPPHNNPGAGPPGSAAAAAAASRSSVRSNVAFAVVVVSVVVLYKGTRLWAWLGVRAQEKRSLLVAQELVFQETRRRRPEPTGIAPTGAAGDAGLLPSGSNSGGSSKEPTGSGSPAQIVGGRKRRKSKGGASAGEPSSSSIAPRAVSRPGLSPLSRPTVLPTPPACPTASSTGSFTSSSRQLVNAVAGPSSDARGVSSGAAAAAPRPSDDGSEEDGSFTVVAPSHLAKRPSLDGSSAKGKGKARETVGSNDAVSPTATGSSSAGAAPVTAPLSKKAKKKAAVAAAAVVSASSKGPVTTSSLALTGGDLSSLSRPRPLVSSPRSASQSDLSPPSSVSSLAMSVSSSQGGNGGGASSEATTLASSTISLGLEFTPLSRTLSASLEPSDTPGSGGSADDKATRQELATALRRLQAAQSMLEATQTELHAARGRLESTEASLATSQSASATAIEEAERERLAGEARSVALADARREADGLRAELRHRDEDARRLADERKRKDKEREKLKRELDRWREDGRRWEVVERDFRKTDTELRFQLHHTSAACHHQLGQIRMLEQVVRQYNMAFAPAAAAASVALTVQPRPSSPSPAIMHSLSPPPANMRPINRRTLSRSSQGPSSPNPFVVVPSPQMSVPYPTLPDPDSTSEEDVSDDVALSILKNPGGLGVGTNGSSRRSRNGSVDSTFDSRSGSSMSTRLDDDERSIGSPANDDKGTPELVFASIPSYDENARPRSSAASSSHGADGLALTGISPAQDRGRSGQKQQPSAPLLLLDDELPTTPMAAAPRPTPASVSAPTVVTPRA